jgi:metal-dependent hydrolase (beta-lactamase superfamily II)
MNTALKRLETLGIDTALLAGTQYAKHAITKIGHTAILNIFEELSKHNGAVRRRLAGLHSVYPKHQEFMTKAATLDVQGLAKALKQLSFLSQSKVYLFWRKNAEHN